MQNIKPYSYPLLKSSLQYSKIPETIDNVSSISQFSIVVPNTQNKSICEKESLTCTWLQNVQFLITWSCFFGPVAGAYGRGGLICSWFLGRTERQISNISFKGMALMIDLPGICVHRSCPHLSWPGSREKTDSSSSSPTDLLSPSGLHLLQVLQPPKKNCHLGRSSAGSIPH